MKKTLLLLLLQGALLTACADDPYRAVYEGIKVENEAKKTPQEREMSPVPGYDAFKKERDSQSGKNELSR